MPVQIVHSNVVVVARQFNPSILSQIWLANHGIVSQSDFDEGESVFTPPFVQVRAPGFTLMVLPEQLQFAPRPPGGDHGASVAAKVGGIVRALPETPYVAVGLNFHWTFEPKPEDYEALCRALFFRDNPLYAEFASDDARYGGYLSKNVFDGRLKLDVKPTKTKTPEGSVERLLFTFNYHTDVSTDNSVADIEQMLRYWSEASESAAQIVQQLEGWQW